MAAINCRYCNHSWFQEESKLEKIDGATTVTKRFVCSNCDEPLHSDIPKSEYTLREYESGSENLRQDIIRMALTTWHSYEPILLCVPNNITEEEFNSTLQAILTEHQEIVAALENLRNGIKDTEEDPPILTYEVSYQQEAFPWDRWSITEVSNRTHPLYEVYEDHSSGITMALCVLVEAETKLDARIAGGTILMEYMEGKVDENNT